MKYFLSVIISTITTFSLMAQSNVQPAYPHLISYDKIRDITISTSGKEAYISIQDPLGEISVLAVIKKVNDNWQSPEILPFSGTYKDLEPFLSPDNLRLFFVSNRPLNLNLSEAKDFDIWYVERDDLNSHWGIPINIGSPVNTEHNEFYPAVTQSGNLYFTCDAPESTGKDDIFISKWNGVSYASPYPLSDAVNSEGYEYNAYVSPDESFILFSGYNREDGFGSADLYISYRKNESWTKAQNLGPKINSPYLDYCPFVDLNSKTLYFTSRRSSINQNPDFHNIEQLNYQLNNYENGLSRIYKVSVDFIP